MVQVPSTSATPLPNSAVPPYRVTRGPALAVPVTVTAFTDTANAEMTLGAAGNMTFRTSEAELDRPAPSVAAAVRAWPPAPSESANRLQAPSLSAIAVPSRLV